MNERAEVILLGSQVLGADELAVEVVETHQRRLGRDLSQSSCVAFDEYDGAVLGVQRQRLRHRWRRLLAPTVLGVKTLQPSFPRALYSRTGVMGAISYGSSIMVHRRSRDDPIRTW